MKTTIATSIDFIIIILFTAAMIGSCKKNKDDTMLPDCVQANIDTTAADEIYLYEYQGNDAYLLKYDNSKSVVIKEDCTTCYPDGGIMPPNSTKCLDFYSKAIKKNRIK